MAALAIRSDKRGLQNEETGQRPVQVPVEDRYTADPPLLSAI
jgi:hypothetical protein